MGTAGRYRPQPSEGRDHIGVRLRLTGAQLELCRYMMATPWRPHASAGKRVDERRRSEGASLTSCGARSPQADRKLEPPANFCAKHWQSVL
jgi:hypothetical protein